MSAWIEIGMYKKLDTATHVALLVSAWIEITLGKEHPEKLKKVALLVSAWIEIFR